MKGGGEEIVYVADPREFAQACQYFTLIHAHKILQLEKYIKSLRSDNIQVCVLNQWFEENQLHGLIIQRLLAYEIRTQSSNDARRSRCLDLISKKYKRSLVEQYEPLILCSIKHPDKLFEPEKYRVETARKIIQGLSINGKKIVVDQEDDDQLLNLLRTNLEKVGLKNDEMIDFLQVYLGFAAKWGNEYHTRMLKKIKVGIASEFNETYLEFNAEDNSVDVHFVRVIGRFYRIKDSANKSSEKQGPADGELGVIARSRVSFQLTLSKATGSPRMGSPSTSPFFQSKKLPFDVQLCGAVLEVLNPEVKSTLIRDHSSLCAKKLSKGMLTNTNDEIIMRHRIRDCAELSIVSKIIERLCAHPDAFRIVLAVRMNSLVLGEILRSPELLACLCSDANHLEYLQLFKFWYSQDDEVMGNLSLLLNRIEVIQTGLVKSKNPEMIISYFRQNRENNELFMYAALHTLLLEEKHDITPFLNNTVVFSVLQKNGWLIKLAMAFEEVAFWLIDSGIILKIKITADQLCHLLKAQAKLWNKLQKQKENVRLLPNKLLSARQLQVLLFHNTDRCSIEEAGLAVSRSEDLFVRLCYLRDTHPNELLRFFCRTHKKFRENWGDAYTECENDLLSQSDEATIRRYYEYWYCYLSTHDFCVLFNAVVLMDEPQTNSDKAHQQAKKVLILLLLKRIDTKSDLSSIWNNPSYLTKIAELLRSEPRVALLLKSPSFRECLKKTPSRRVIRAFVNCVLAQYNNPEFHQANLAMTVLSFLRSHELKEVISFEGNRLFMIKTLITEYGAIELLMTVDNPLEELGLIFQTASVQQRVLLLMAFSARENELRAKLESYAKLIDEFRETMVDHQQELEAIVAFKRSILESRACLEQFIAPGGCSAIDLASLFSICPDLIQRLRSLNLSTQQQRDLEEALLIIQPPDHEVFHILTKRKGVDSLKFTAKMEELWLAKEYEAFHRLINACLMLAFHQQDILNAIITTPQLLDFIVLRAELRLVAKLISLFGRRGGFDTQLEAFFDRLATQPKLSRQYRLLFNLPSDTVLPLGDLKSLSLTEALVVGMPLNEASELSLKSSNKICQLFFLCSESQLHRYASQKYVNTLIESIALFNADRKVYQRYVLPRLATTLICLFEVDPHFIEAVFSDNPHIVELLKSSPYALDELLCSSLYEQSETIRRILDIHPLVDADLLDDSASPRLEGRMSIRMDVSRSSSSPGSLRIRSSRRVQISVGGGGDSDPDLNSTSSFSKL